MEQRTEEWFNARLGKVTASAISNVLSSGVTHKNYLLQLVSERLTGEKTETIVTPAMQHGIDNENDARLLYVERHQGVIEEGFIDHPKVSMSGMSPDGLTSDGKGLIEIKCPQNKTHTETLIEQKVPSRYLNQIMWQLACCPDREYCDFVSYNPAFPDNLKLFVKRVPRDNDYIKKLEKEVKAFTTKVDNIVNNLKEIK